VAVAPPAADSGSAWTKVLGLMLVSLTASAADAGPLLQGENVGLGRDWGSAGGLITSRAGSVLMAAGGNASWEAAATPAGDWEAAAAPAGDWEVSRSLCGSVIAAW